MKKFLGLLVMMLMVTSNCLAMTFSQPVKLGSIWLDTAGKRGNGYLIEGALSNKGNYYTRYNKNNKQSFSNGIAQFGSSTEVIFVHYSMNESGINSNGAFFGSNNDSNAVRIPIWEVANIFQINTNEHFIFYSIDTGYGGVGHCTVIGKKENGVWVKYIDTQAITEKYLGKTSVGKIFCSTPSCKGNQIIVQYNVFNEPVIRGEFRFKWDDKAQWFGVEQVVY